MWVVNVGSESSQDRKNGLIIECPMCGCPNRPSDRLCTYCRAELSAAPAQPGFIKSVADYLEYYMNYLKFRLKTPRRASNAKHMSKTVLVTLFALSLVGVGLYLLFAAIKGAGFLYLCIGLLLVLYGGGVLNNLYRRGGDSGSGSRGQGGGGGGSDRYH